MITLCSSTLLPSRLVLGYSLWGTSFECLIEKMRGTPSYLSFELYHFWGAKRHKYLKSQKFKAIKGGTAWFCFTLITMKKNKHRIPGMVSLTLKLRTVCGLRSWCFKINFSQGLISNKKGGFLWNSRKYGLGSIRKSPTEGTPSIDLGP